MLRRERERCSSRGMQSSRKFDGDFYFVFFSALVGTADVMVHRTSERSRRRPGFRCLEEVL